MKIILLEDVKTLGKAGQVVEVSTGYARNMLIPKKLGVEATPKNLNDLKLKKAHEDKVAAENLAAAKELQEALEKGAVELKIKTGENGKVFGSVSSKEIAEAVKTQLGLDIDKKKIQLAAPIKELGEASIGVKLHPQVTASLKINIKEA